jgi:hypothetical protein
VEHGPGGGQQDRGGNQDEPEVHGGWSEGNVVILRNRNGTASAGPTDRSISMHSP